MATIWPDFPVYVISKGRWRHATTPILLAQMGIPFHMIVEHDEYENYAGLFGAERLDVLPDIYTINYQMDLAVVPGVTGPGPARNYVRDLASNRDAEYYWCLDDNITDFLYVRDNRRVRAGDGTWFRIMEDFATQFANLALVGPQYRTAYSAKTMNNPPLAVNSNVRSCNLMKTGIPYVYQQQYDEDVDLTLRLLKVGWCTARFNFLLINKPPSQTTPGGNTEQLYRGREQERAEHLLRAHPDLVTLYKRGDRTHARVAWGRHKNNRLVKHPQAPDVSLMRYNVTSVSLGDTQ